MQAVPHAPEAAGFGNCAVCPYRMTGSVETCFNCASRTMEALAKKRCLTCDRELGEGGSCGNPLCNRSVAERGWDYIFAISMRSGALRKAINLYKYDGKTGWAYIFGRVLVGYLQASEEEFRDYDLILSMPTYVGPGGRDRDHVAEVLDRAAAEDPSWPFRTDLITRTSPTPRLAEVSGGYAARARVAEHQISAALELHDEAAVRGAHVLVFDDVFTSGLTLQQVALALNQAGALRVSGIVLARQPWRR